MDCYTGCDTGVIFLSEAAVVNLTDLLQRRLNRLAQVSYLFSLYALNGNTDNV